MTNRDKRRGVALIGCGAIAESFHLPALLRRPGLARELILVDPNIERARQLGAPHGIDRTATDYKGLLGELRGAIIATPHALHYDIARTCVESGVHVLSEKPLTETGHEARELIAAADRTGAQVVVNNTRRLVPSFREIARRVRAGELGRITGLEYAEGDRFDWPAVSGSSFGRASGGRGVLFDIGAHVLDLVCWWLGERPRIERYRDDSLGGSEAVCCLEFSSGTCRGTVDLSWISKLDNEYAVHGELGSLGGSIYDWTSFWQSRPGGKRQRVSLPDRVSVYTDLSHVLLENFEAVMNGAAAPLISAADVLPSIEMIEAAYARRERFDMPWFPFAAAAPERESVHA
jgi:predicted dehydrogenase